MDDLKELGEYIQGVRKAEGITQQELADRLEIAKVTVTLYESGRNNLTFKTLQRIAKALGYRLEIRLVKDNS